VGGGLFNIEGGCPAIFEKNYPLLYPLFTIYIRGVTRGGYTPSYLVYKGGDIRKGKKVTHFIPPLYYIYKVAPQ
jgi:hypothetical protein